MGDTNFNQRIAALRHEESIGSDQNLYEAIGGEATLRKLIEVFYDIIEFEPEGEVLLVLHRRGHGVAHSRIEQFNYLSGFFGGPQLYVQKYGHSDVRLMHEHVEINAEARDSWLQCMSTAIDRVGIAPDLKEKMMGYFTKIAPLVTNR